MIANPYLILLPLILLGLGGYICAWLFALSEDTLVRVVTDFFMPMLVFYSLYTSTINLEDTMKLGGAVGFVLFFLLIASLVYCHVFNLDKRAFLPPIIFMNSGFLGIPLMELWGASGAVNQIVIYDQIQTFFIFTLGIFIVAGGFTLSGLVEIFKTPLLWSIILVSGVALPSAVFSVILPLRYGVDPRFAGAMILLSTLLSIFTIPVVFYLSSKF